MCRCENVIVGDQTAATELFAGLEEHRYPRELMWTGIDAAHNALLVGRHGVSVATLQGQTLRTVATCWTTCCGCRGHWVGGSPGGRAAGSTWRTRCGAPCGKTRGWRAWIWSWCWMRGILMTWRVRGYRWWPTSHGRRMRGNRWWPLLHTATKVAKWPLIGINCSCRRRRSWCWRWSWMWFRSSCFNWVHVLKVRCILHTIHIIDGIWFDFSNMIWFWICRLFLLVLHLLDFVQFICSRQGLRSCCCCRWCSQLWCSCCCCCW